MSDWPNMTMGPIREWPGQMTRNRTAAPFRTSGNRTPLSSTLEVLERELRALRAKGTELLVAIRPEDFRLDGKPRANAIASHPGVILSFRSKHGPLSYPCDTFTHWQDNLRAIALALEALRKVDRYGVTSHGQQYRGFLALPAGIAAPAGFSTHEEARSFLWTLVRDSGMSIPDLTAMTTTQLLRRAQRISHPDVGGDPVVFERVSLAEKKLREAGLL